MKYLEVLKQDIIKNVGEEYFKLYKNIQDNLITTLSKLDFAITTTYLIYKNKNLRNSKMIKLFQESKNYVQKCQTDIDQLLKLTKEDIPDLTDRQAIFVYEGARLHAIQLNCPVIPSCWEDREDDFKQQFIQLIADLCSGKKKFQNFEEAHNSWMKKYFEMGWTYGNEYDPEKRTHPDLVPYNDLDAKEKVKDEVFVRLVEIAKECIW